MGVKVDLDADENGKYSRVKSSKATQRTLSHHGDFFPIVSLGILIS